MNTYEKTPAREFCVFIITDVACNPSVKDSFCHNIYCQKDNAYLQITAREVALAYINDLHEN